MKSMKISDYFEIRKQEYVYIKITSHKSIRNFNSSNIAKAIALTYKTLTKQLKIENKRLVFETGFSIKYIIDIKHGECNFYFMIPKFFQNILLEKINEIWSKATLTIVDNIEPFSVNSDYYELGYKKLDALSLTVDKKSNEPLNSILSVMDIIKDDDRLTIVTNFKSCSQFGWIERYNEAMDKFKNKKSLDKATLSPVYIFKIVLSVALETLDTVMEVVNSILGGKKEENKESLYQQVLGVLEQQSQLSLETKKKKESTILPTQIAIISSSIDSTRRNNNLLSTCQAYRVLDGDNELRYKKVKPFTLNQTDIGTSINIFSTDEVSSFIKIPGRSLLQQFKIKYIETEETEVPIELREGTKRLGESTFKGKKQNAFLENEYNNGNLPLVLIGSQGSGKTTLMENYGYDCSNANEGLIVIDFIKNCELSDNIKRVVPKDKIIELDLASKEGIQGLGYNEIITKNNMDSFTKLKLASLQSQQVMSLIDGVSVGDPLSSRMRRFLNAAATVVFVQGYNSVKNVVECLENHIKRRNYINGLNIELRGYLEDELNTLSELDEWSKGSKATKDKEAVEPEIVGTNSSKIEHVLDRVGMLREDFKLKYMYNKSLENNINLVDVMENGKILFIKMKESDFPTKMQKNILVTYWITKIWLASQLRGINNQKPSRCNILIDEVFQSPTSMSILEYILPQSRKFGCKFIFSTQYIKQLDTIFDTLEASGSSFMLLTGSNESDFNHFKSKLENFEYDDLVNMKKFHSLNLIKYSKGYASFITALPKPI